MYRLTDIMLQNLEKDLKKIHELFQGWRCQAWQLEELIAKAIRSDFNKSEGVIWKGNGHDISSDIIVNKTHAIQIKSGTITKDKLVLSGHRLGSFKEDFKKITEFLNHNTYLLVAVLYYVKECELGKSHTYQIYYIDSKILKIDDYKKWQKKKSHYYCQNEYGVDLSIRPAMSWQIWWNIPLSSLNETDKTRLIVIN